MKKYIGQLLGLAALGMLGGESMYGADKSSPVRLEDISGEPKEQPIPKGHTKFVIDGKTVYALNYKNAKKKADKIK
jgi:hypothetical protein